MSIPVRRKSRFTPQEIHFSLTTVTAPYANRVAEIPAATRARGLVLAAGASTDTPGVLLGRLGLQGFRWGAAVDLLVFGGESTVVQEAPFVRYGCGGGDIGVCRQ
jgi:hypothetical protein